MENNIILQSHPLKGVDSRRIANNIKPFYPVHPGGLLKEELECRNLQQKEFAKKLGLPYAAFNEILNEKRPVTWGVKNVVFQ